MTELDYTDGIHHAEQRYTGAMYPAQIAEQYQETLVRKPSPVAPYVRQETAPSVQPSIYPMIAKGVAGVSFLVIAAKVAAVGISALFIWIESNALACGAALVAVVALSGLRASAGLSDPPTSGRVIVETKTTVTTETKTIVK